MTQSLNPAAPVPAALAPHGGSDEVKNFFSPSDWLFIGSALSSSSAMGVVFLKLVGRVSFTKPFSICVVTTIVLGILAEMFKNQKYDMAPVIATFKSVVPTPQLGEGSTFHFEEQNYYIAPTRGDGACGAHAVLGIKETGSYAYPGPKDVREVYKEELVRRLADSDFRKKWEEWMINFIKDFITIRGYYSPMVFGALDLGELNRNLAAVVEKERSLKQDLRKLYDLALRDEENIIMAILRREAANQEMRTGAEGLQAQLEVDNEFKYGKMNECLDSIIAALDGKEIGREMAENLKIQGQIDDKRTECYRAFIQKDEVLAAYLQGVLNPAYYFATQELGLMAFLFGRHVRVFHEIEGVVTLELNENTGEGTSVEVFHQHSHFSRCELQNSL